MMGTRIIHTIEVKFENQYIVFITIVAETLRRRNGRDPEVFSKYPPSTERRMNASQAKYAEG